MEIERASEMGFCFGVRRAIELVERAASERGPLRTLGPLVHNQQVVDRLARSGITVAESLDDVRGDPVAITSHGVGPEVIREMEARGLAVIDATCPFVRKAQAAAQKLGEEGFRVLVFGDASHPEVQGLLGWAGENAGASLEVPQLDTAPKRLGILCQTTQNQQRFLEFVTRVISQSLPEALEIRVLNTICDATSRHQAAALELARRVNMMLVVGGRDSANTARLAQICAETGVETHHIETAADMDTTWLRGRRRVGITAGASTPDDVVDEVALALEGVARKN